MCCLKLTILSASLFLAKSGQWLKHTNLSSLHVLRKASNKKKVSSVVEKWGNYNLEKQRGLDKHACFVSMRTQVQILNSCRSWLCCTSVISIQSPKLTDQPAQRCKTDLPPTSFEMVKSKNGHLCPLNCVCLCPRAGMCFRKCWKWKRLKPPTTTVQKH